MSAPIGPGDWVEYIGDNTGSRWPGDISSLTIGGLYQVREAGIRGTLSDGRSAECLRLVGVVKFVPGFAAEAGFCVESFRPIYRPDEKLTERLLEGLPQHTNDLVSA